MLVGGIPRNYKLRWKFEYLWGREKHGLWSERGNEDQQAQNQTRCELVKVHLEAFNVRTEHTHKVFTVDALEFESFKFKYIAHGNADVKEKEVFQGLVCEAQLWSKTFVHTMDIVGNTSIIRREDFPCQ